MNNNTTKKHICKPIINQICPTSESITGRAGLALFVRYLRTIKIDPLFERFFGSLRKSRKGLPVSEIFKQLICFFVDGTSRHLVYFDALKDDPAYASTIETPPDSMISSHALKRFFRSFWWPRIFLFRRLLQKLFIWRLKLTKPDIIVLGLDLMILDNDDARCRHGVQMTYKKVGGFGALQLTWNRFIIDAVLRGGKKHSNHQDTAKHMIQHIVDQIRKHYQKDVPIVVRFDSGFFDQELFSFFESINIGYIGAGKLYKDLKSYIRALDQSQWWTYEKTEQIWDVVEFADRRSNWDRFRRAFFLRPRYQNAQQLLEFARPETIIYTNLGMEQKIDELLRKAGLSRALQPQWIVETYHNRGSDELIFRALKDFASEKLPFKRFNQNAAWFSTMLVAFFLFESFKEDVCKDVVAVTAYPTTVRRLLIDFAAKIVHHAGKIILKVPKATWKRLLFAELWKRCSRAPILCQT